MSKTTAPKTADEILSAAFAEMEQIDSGVAPESLEGLEGAGADDGLDDLGGEPGEEFEGEPGDDLSDDMGGEPVDDLGGEPSEEFEGEPGDDLGGEPEEELEEADAVDPSAPVMAFASVEAEINAIERKQGLDRIPQGVTASADDLVDYLLATGAIVEIKLPSIDNSARRSREAAFASLEDEAEYFATADELGEIGDDLTGADGEDGPLDPADDFEEPAGEIALEAGDLDLGDLGADEPEEPAAPAAPAVEEPAAPAAPADEAAANQACASTAVNYHPVADEQMVAQASASDVQMVLTPGSDPRWNVIIAGVPAAAITFSGLQQAMGVPASAIASFQSEDYRRSTLDIMAQQGVAQVLADVGAEFYANAYTQSDLAVEIRASAHQEIGAEYANRVVATRDQLIDLGTLVTSGMSKGYFKSGSPLQAHATQVLAAAGVLNPESAALRICEALPETFEAAMVKASEYMDKSPEFVQQLRESIDEAAPRVRTVEASAPVAVATAAARQPMATRLAHHTLTAPAPVTAATQTTGPVNSVADFKARLAPKIGMLGRIHR